MWVVHQSGALAGSPDRLRHRRHPRLKRETWGTRLHGILRRTFTAALKRCAAQNHLQH
jgi:hypothetical protein